MRLRFQADADFKNSAVVAIARRWSFIDIRSAQRVIPAAFPDPDMLAFAASEGRVLLTHDVTTTPEHFRRFVDEHESPGIILVRQDRSIGSIMEGVYSVVALDTGGSAKFYAMVATLDVFQACSPFLSRASLIEMHHQP